MRYVHKCAILGQKNDKLQVQEETHTQKDIDTQVYERSDETKCEIDSDAGMKPLLQYETTKYQIEILLKYNKNFDDDLSTSHTHTHRYTDT